jgi:ArsR family transcriptional regulator, arsenate/arsenite/antimonite-responsive transcriptional repressor
MNELLAVMGALSDRNRVRAVVACMGRELCVCQIIELLGLAPSTVSKHLWILRQAGLLESRKDGRWIYYRIPAKLKRPAKNALQLLEAATADDAEIAKDCKRLKGILKCDQEKLCLKQRTEAEG